MKDKERNDKKLSDQILHLLSSYVIKREKNPKQSNEHIIRKYYSIRKQILLFSLYCLHPNINEAHLQVVDFAIYSG